MKKLILIGLIFISANIAFAQDTTTMQDCEKLMQQMWQCELNSKDTQYWQQCFATEYGRCVSWMPKRYNERCEKLYKPKVQECLKLVK